MKILIKISIIFIVIAFNACKNKTKETHFKNIQTMKDQKIEFPDTIHSMVNYSKELNEIYNEKNIKLISFTDGRCVACIKNLKGLNKVRKELDTIPGADVNLISFVLIESKKHFIKDYYPELDSLPLILVNDYHFLEKNKFPVSGIYHTLLVNADNEIQLVGNPYQNKKLKKLYRERIKTLVEKIKTDNPQENMETKVVEKTKVKYKEENKDITLLRTTDGKNSGILHLEHQKSTPFVINKDTEMHFSLMNAENNKEPVLLKIMDDSGETIKEVNSKLNKITYFSLQPESVMQYYFKTHYASKKKGKAILFFYLIQ